MTPGGPPDRPSGVWPVLWSIWATYVVGGFITADVLNVSRTGWVWYWGIAVVWFFTIEIPALRLQDRGQGPTLTEHVQYLVGNSRWTSLGYVLWVLSTALLFLQGLRFTELGIWWVWSYSAPLLASLWTWDHFLGPDSRVWVWENWQRRSRSVSRGL